MIATRTAALVLLPTLSFVAVLMAGGAAPLRAAARSGPSATVVGVTVNPVIGDRDADFPQHAFQGTQDQTRLAIVIDSPSGGLVSFDRDGSTVEVFADSTGQGLTDPDSPFSPFGYGERIVDDGQRLAFEVNGAQVPADGARWVEVKGLAAVRIAHQRVTWRAERAPLTKGSEWIAGPHAFEVLRFGESSWGEGYEVELRTKDEVATIIEWALVDGAERHPLERTSTMSFNGTSQITLRCDQELSAGALELVAWKDPKTVRVPFAAKVRVGLE